MVPEQLAHTSSFVSLVTELDKICQAGEAGSVFTVSQFWQLKTADTTLFRYYLRYSVVIM